MKVGTGAGTAVVALVEKGLVPGGTAGGYARCKWACP